MKRRIRKMVHESLSACLAELYRIRPATLLQYEPLGKSHRFRAELPYLDRTLEMFHRLSRRDLTCLPFDLLRNITADASTTRRQFSRITALASERSDNFDETLEGLINEVKHSFDQMFANFARVLSQGSERTSGLTNARVAVAVCMLVAALAILAHYSTHDKTVTDALLRAAHRMGLSQNIALLTMGTRNDNRPGQDDSISRQGRAVAPEVFEECEWKDE